MRLPLARLFAALCIILSLAHEASCQTRFLCSFQRNECGFVSETSDKKSTFSWYRTLPLTSSNGPDADNSLKTGEGYLAAVDTRAGIPGDKTTYTSKPIDCEGVACCVSFYYNIDGLTNSNLSVYMIQGTDQIYRNKIVTLGGQSLGNRWRRYATTMSPFDAFKLDFEVVRGKGGGNDPTIAIDDIQLDVNACATDSKYITLPLECSFENDMCGLKQADNDDMDWSWQRGPTPTDKTGPPGASDGDWYLYTEASGANRATARLNSALIALTTEDKKSKCIDLYLDYHMYGISIGDLQMYVRYTGGVMGLRLLSGEQGNKWQRMMARLELKRLPPTTEEIDFVIEATRVLSTKGDVAIDNVKLLMNECGDSVSQSQDDWRGTEVRGKFEEFAVDTDILCYYYCKTTSSCKASMYNSGTKSCRLVSQIDGELADSPNWTTTMKKTADTCYLLSYETPTGKSFTYSAAPTEVQQDPKYIQSAEDCISYCLASSTCKAVGYDSPFNGRCYIYTSDTLGKPVSRGSKLLSRKFGCLQNSVCKMPDMGEHTVGAALHEPITSFGLGSKIKFMCPRDTGYTLNGNSEVTCTPAGWSPFPYCKFQGLCQVGTKTLVEKVPKNPMMSSWMQIFPQQTFGCAGEIQRWTFFAANTLTPVYLSVWELVSGGIIGKFKLVGFNKVLPKQLGLQSVDVPQGERVTVKPGHFIGYHYDSDQVKSTALIFFTFDSKIDMGPYGWDDMTETRVAMTYHSQNNLGKGSVVTAQKIPTRRVPQFQAYITNPVECSRIPLPLVGRLISTQGYSPGNKATIGCANGYTVEGNAEVECLSTGLWTQGPECSYPGDSTDCGFPPFVQNSEYSISGKSVGDKLTFSCHSGYKFDDPNYAVVTCQTDKTWGQRPTCLLDEICSAGLSAVHNTNAGLPPSLSLMLLTGKPFTCPGSIKVWQFYSRRVGGSVRLSVFRPSGTAFRLISYTLVKTTATGIVEVLLGPGQHIQVERGDVIGLIYDFAGGAKEESVVVVASAASLQTYPASELATVKTAMLGSNDVKKGSLVSTTDEGKYVVAVRAIVTNSLGCGKPMEIANGKVTYSTTMTSSVATYTCDPTFKILGNGMPKCLDSGMWASEPTCAPEEGVCAAGKTAPADLQLARPWLRIYSDFFFSCEGVVTSWQMYARKTGVPAYLGVWKSLGLRQFQLMGVTKVVAGKLGMNTFNLGGSNRIAVKKGWLVGIHYEVASDEEAESVVGVANHEDPSPWVNDDLYIGYSLRAGVKDISDASGVVTMSGGPYNNYHIPNLMVFVQKLADCGAPPMPLNGKSMYTSTSLNSEATYECNKDYELVGGKSVCLSTGWTNATPMCNLKTKCTAGPTQDKVQNYGGSFSARSSRFNIFTNMKFACEGLLARWSFWANNKQRVHIVVLELNSANNGYTLVGQTVITATQTGYNDYVLPELMRFPVSQNHVIGIGYHRPNLPQQLQVIPYAEAGDLSVGRTNVLFDVLELDADPAKLIETSQPVDMGSVQRGKRAPALVAHVI